MLQINHYKKSCYLTDSEKDKMCEFFKTMFEVDQIEEVHWYLDENNESVVDIIGFNEPKSKVVGSNRKHDREAVKDESAKL